MNAEALKQIGERICERRKQLHLTQEQLAEMMNVSIQMISNLERGNKAIKIENLIRISEILKVSTDYILFGEFSNRDISVTAEKISKLSESDYKMIDMLIDYCLNK